VLHRYRRRVRDGPGRDDNRSRLGHTHGFVLGEPNKPVTFVGVVPATLKQLEIRDRIGRTITVDLSADDGYWVQVVEPVAHIVSRQDGTTTETPFPPGRAIRRSQG
jgi:hypothetical protein